jgi:hypothetical protein
MGVKGQSNLEIAGTPRNSFRVSLENKCGGGRALDGLGPFTGYQTQPNSECRYMVRRSETVGDKVHSREGNSPDRQLRSLNLAKWERKCDY